MGFSGICEKGNTHRRRIQQTVSALGWWVSQFTEGSRIWGCRYLNRDRTRQTKTREAGSNLIDFSLCVDGMDTVLLSPIRMLFVWASLEVAGCLCIVLSPAPQKASPSTGDAQSPNLWYTFHWIFLLTKNEREAALAKSARHVAGSSVAGCWGSLCAEPPSWCLSSVLWC